MIRKILGVFEKRRVKTFLAILILSGGITWNFSDFGKDNEFDEINVMNLADTFNFPDKLEDIILSNSYSEFGRKIIFIETSNVISLLHHSPKDSEFQVELNARQACAIESAALMNPNTKIFVLFVGDNFRVNLTAHPILNAVLSYSNVQFHKLNLNTYVIGTPIYKWFKTGKLFESHYLVSHMSDFLRYITLWKQGGIYFDMDVIILKSFENIPENFACAESDDTVASGIMSFGADGFGHQVANLCLLDFQENFKGYAWAHNGPGVITRVLKKICQTEFIKNMTNERCNGFTVYPKETFYAIEYPKWEYFFNPEHLHEVMDKIKDSLLTHVWNKLSKTRQIKVGSKVAYAQLAEKYCPKVYASCGDFF